MQKNQIDDDNYGIDDNILLSYVIHESYEVSGVSAAAGQPNVHGIAGFGEVPYKKDTVAW